jgi:hypothetical protein
MAERFRSSAFHLFARNLPVTIHPRFETFLGLPIAIRNMAIVMAWEIENVIGVNTTPLPSDEGPIPHCRMVFHLSTGGTTMSMIFQIARREDEHYDFSDVTEKAELDR